MDIDKYGEGIRYLYAKTLDFLKGYHKGFVNYYEKKQLRKGLRRFFFAVVQLEERDAELVARWEELDEYTEAALLEKIKSIYVRNYAPEPVEF